MNVLIIVFLVLFCTSCIISTIISLLEVKYYNDVRKIYEDQLQKELEEEEKPEKENDFDLLAKSSKQ